MTSENTTPKKETPLVKTLGLLLEALALPILITVAVLLNIENKNLGIVGLLLSFGTSMFVVGFVLAHLPKTR